MSLQTTQSEIEILSAQIRERGEILRTLDPRINQLARDIKRLRIVVTYFAAALWSRHFVERLGIWRQGVFIVAPFLFGAIATIGIHLVLGVELISIAVGLLVLCLSPFLLLGLLVYPATEVVRTRKDAAAASLAEQREYHRKSMEKSVELTNANLSAGQRLKELQKDVAHLELIESRGYQLKQLYARNWRAMRSVEFEQFLEEVFTILGYSVITTQVTGDQGVDLVVEKKGMRVAVQVKGYLNSVSNGAVQEAYAGMAHYSCDACAVITNSVFTSSAESLARSTRCVLIGETNFRDFVLGRFDLVDSVPHP